MSGSRPSTFTLTAPGPLRLLSMTELLRLPPPEWLVQDVLPAGGLVGLYGQPGHYKSFVAIDIAMSVATGTPWQGAKVKRGHALYVAAEGGVGIAKRGEAWLLDKHVDPSAVDISWLTESIPVSVDSENMDRLFDRINNELNTQPAVVVIDTLARCFDGDENLQEDMGRFIGGVDRLRRDFDATVIVVHHTRLDAERERGSTAFRGAADTMVYVKKTKDEELEVSCNKQKDSEEFLTRHLALKKVKWDSSVTGQPMDSVVLIEPIRERSASIVEAIRVTGGMKFTELKKAMGSPKQGSPISPSALKRRLAGLVQTGEIIRKNGIYVLAE